MLRLLAESLTRDRLEPVCGRDQLSHLVSAAAGGWRGVLPHYAWKAAPILDLANMSL